MGQQLDAIRLADFAREQKNDSQVTNCNLGNKVRRRSTIQKKKKMKKISSKKQQKF